MSHSSLSYESGTLTSPLASITASPVSRRDVAGTCSDRTDGYTLDHAGRQVRIGPVAFWIVVGTLVDHGASGPSPPAPILPFVRMC